MCCEMTGHSPYGFLFEKDTAQQPYEIIYRRFSKERSLFPLKFIYDVLLLRLLVAYSFPISLLHF